MSSVWSDTLTNLQNILQLSQHQEAHTPISKLLQDNLLLTQQEVLPTIHHIFTKYQNTQSTFALLAQKFPKDPIAIKTWGQAKQAASNLIVAIHLATPFYEKLPAPTKPQPIEILVGKQLINIIKQKQLASRVDEIRQKLHQKFGFPFPHITFRDDFSLQPHHYQIILQGEIHSGVMLATQHLAISTNGEFPTLQGIECTDPIFGLPAKWINALFAETARKQNYIVLDPLGVLIAHLERLLRQRYASFFSGSILATLIKQGHDLASTYLLLPKTNLIQIFRTCIRSQISLREFSIILDRLLKERSKAPEDMRLNSDYLYVQLRLYFTPAPLKKQLQQGKILCLQFDEASKTYLMNSLSVEEQLIYLENAQTIVRTLSEYYLAEQNKQPFILCPDFIVPALYRQFERNSLSLPLVIESEIPDHITIEQCGELIHLAHNE